MKKIPRKLWVISQILCITTGILGCNNKYLTQKQQTFNDLFPLVNMNEMLELGNPGIIIGETTSKDLDLVLKNISREKIGFPVDYGIRIFSYSDRNGWKEVDNHVNYFGESRILQPKGNGLNSSTVIFIRPSISDLEGLNRIRVVVIGHILQNNQPTTRKVGAFLDINMDE